MGQRRLILITLLLASGCPKKIEPRAPQHPDLPEAVTGFPAKVAADFQQAILTGREAYEALFDFAAVGEMEILLHRYDLNGRMELTDDEIDRFSAEDGTPYTAEREKKNVGNFYDYLGTRTVGQGDCSATLPKTKYGKLLARPYEPLPEGTPEGYEILRTHANEWMANGGVVRIGGCRGGKGGLVLVYTKKGNARGYDLITIYDD
ncbi:MAG: hypothetical protein M4D80_03565 [Myxococcota bacterium]|nr:hypothetical protein [Myxococcota bacterium]